MSAAFGNVATYGKMAHTFPNVALTHIPTQITVMFFVELRTEAW